MKASCLLLSLATAAAWAGPPAPLLKSLETDNLVAWCVVPFDSAKRSPAERAEMLEQLGIRRCAYDWRQEHVSSFEQEILEYKRHGIEFFAFWDRHPEAFRLFEKHGLRPQIWKTAPSPAGATDAERVAAAAEAMAPLAEETGRLGFPLGLYNHGGWGGEPENLVAVCQALRDRGHEHVGIVYNFHHGHPQIDGFAAAFKTLRPYLLCLNINGMNRGADPKILGLGQGRHELEMLRAVADSGYDGPIGILDHRADQDTRKVLQENLDGLRWLRAELREAGSGGPKPTPPDTTPPGNGAAGRFPHARLIAGDPRWRSGPITAECLATLPGAQNYNILLASDTKQSANHWELFSMRGSGQLTAYLPGFEPDHVASGTQVCDGRPHHLEMIYEPSRVRLLVDGEVVADQAIRRSGGEGVDGQLGIGRLVEGGLGCHGTIHWARISQGVRLPTAATPHRVPAHDKATLGLWEFPTADDADDADDAAAPAPYNPQQVERIVREATERGDVVRGAAVFSAARFACLSCHKIGRHGGDVGPDLTRIATERSPQQLVESLFWPRRTVEPKYVHWQVLTGDGERIKGYRVAADEQSVVLRDPATGRERRVDRGEIEREAATGTLMPDGIAQAMTPQQQWDVVRLLMSLGRSDQGAAERVASVLMHAHSHAPVEFSYDRRPLDPRQWPSWRHPVNRDRIYDFYTKQAEHFRQLPHAPPVLGAFPGLDGGEQGHWGNQNEETWADGRWNETVLGSVQCGVFRGAGKTVPRAVCVQLEDGLSACFNPDTLTYEVVWKDGFVGFSSVRHGFLGGLQMEGQQVECSPQQLGATPDEPFVYRGFHRAGERVLFAYTIGDVEYLNAPLAADGKFAPVVAPRDRHPLGHLTQGGPPQWPQQLTTKVRLGEGGPYVVDTFPLPQDNPWRALMFCGGHDFFADGSAVICTMQGDVWQMTEAQGEARWRRIAAGLHQPLGLVVADNKAYVQGRDQITRLHDLNGDGETDFYECFSNAAATSPAGHDFICGLERDSEGRFYTCSGNQGLLRISADGRRADVLARGFRNPDGLGLLPDGTVTVPCSEGAWTPASMICAVTPAMQQREPNEPPPFFGHGGPSQGDVELPLVYLPRGLDNSAGGQTYVNSDRWGPMKGRLLHFSFGAGRHFLVLRDEVDGRLQGAVVPLPGEFLSGAHRGRFHPLDGQLYVSGMAGWGSYTPDDGCFQRVRYTGAAVQMPTGFHVHRNGVRVSFAQPLDPATAAQPSSHFAQCWNYRYSGAYGSPEWSTRHVGVVGHDTLPVTACHLLDDGRSLFLELDVQPCSQLHLRMNVGPGQASDLLATVHKLDGDYTQLPGYRPVDKLIAAHPLEVDLAAAASRRPNPYSKKIQGARRLVVETGPNLSYATPFLEASAGEPLELVLKNVDVVPHNWALVQGGALRAVGERANRLIADPRAYARQYIPETDEVLAHTDVVGPGDQFTIYFHAPKAPGRYPFLCTFPGHWMVMNGEMIVK